MIGIKAIAALALAGLGSATMATDIYLSSPVSARPPPPAPADSLPVLVNAPVAHVPEKGIVVTLDPIMIYARDRSAHGGRGAPPLAVPRAESRLEICSDWRSLETGPESRGVRSLCVPTSSAGERP